MSALFASNDMFEISIQYLEVVTKSGLKSVRVLDPKNDKDLITRKQAEVKKLTTFWTQPSWKQSNELYRKCTRFDPEAGRRLFDPSLHQALLLESFMKKWDACEDSGKPIPCDKENVDRLDPAVAVSLANEFNDRVAIDEDELGN